MNKAIIRTWNRTVKPEDIVIIMGDNGNGDLEQMKSVISQLNGEKTATSKHLNEKFSKAEWREIGFKHFWGVSMFNTLEDGREILYVIKPVINLDAYKKDYALLVVDSENPIEGMTKDIMLSADAAKWGYSPLDTAELLTIYENMKEFESMESTETRSDIKEEGEE
jgi:ATPase subunit of ABC transporter with duplicated ATPase domains